MTKFPPLTLAVWGRFVLHSRSLLPQPLPPVSKVHFEASGEDPSAPLNSSLHTRVHAARCCGVIGSHAMPQPVSRGRIETSAPRSTSAGLNSLMRHSTD